METAETKTVQIVVNGQPHTVPEGIDVGRLLRLLEIDPARVAVELDRAIVRKQDWSVTVVQPGAQLEIVWFVGGG